MDKTATEQLCDLLDERGTNYTTMMRPHGIVVVWKDAHGNEWEAADDGSGGLDVIPLDVLTPEQAIEATLGRPTAYRHVKSYGATGTCTCSECHVSVGAYDGFCRKCGARLTETRYEEVGKYAF